MLSREVVEVILGETDRRTRKDCLDPFIQPTCVCDIYCPFTSEEECFDSGQCADSHVLRFVKRQTIHPLYRPMTMVGFE